MSYGSNVAVEDAEDDYEEQIAQEIAMNAAELVAAGDMSRTEAINVAAEYQRYLQEAENDVTGSVETLYEAQRPRPSRKVPINQVRAIATKLMDDAQNAVMVFLH